MGPPREGGRRKGGSWLLVAKDEWKKEEKAEKLQTKVLMKVTVEVCVDHVILNPLDLRKIIRQNITKKCLNTNIPSACTLDYLTSGA